MEGLLQVGLEPAEAFTGDFTRSRRPLSGAVGASQQCLRRASQGEASTARRFLLDRAGARRTLSGDDAQTALATRSWLGGRASQRTASVNYSGADVDVACGFLHNPHSVRAALAAGRAKAHTWDPVCDRRIRNGGGRLFRSCS
jgi:hypothetical protein